MKNFETIQYDLFLKTKGAKRVIDCKEQNGNKVNFSGAVNKKFTPKIYVLKWGTAIGYIGFTSQNIGARLSGGLWADGRAGYHGYKWQTKNKLRLFVFVFEAEIPKKIKQASDDEKKAYLKAIEPYETLEAELVFKIRNETGKYPIFQNEIHFHNEKIGEVKGTVEKIFALINTK